MLLTPVSTVFLQTTMSQMVKNLPTVQEIWVQSLAGEVTLKKEISIHSGILAWRIPWTEEPGGIKSMGHKESDTTEQLTIIFYL